MSNKQQLVLETVPPLPTDCWPATIQQFVKMLPKWLRVSSANAGDLTLVTFGQSTPATDNSDKPWVKTDPNGRPLGLYVFYNGGWVKAYGHDVGDVIIFSGLADNHASVDTLPWRFCDGSDGTPDLRPQMVVESSGPPIVYRLGYKMFKGYA